MPYSSQYRGFIHDKQGFFRQTFVTEGRPENTVTLTEEYSDTKSFKFLHDNRSLIENEFNQLFSALQNFEHENEDQEREKFWLYCYYCSLMLENYYRAYGKLPEAEKYKKLGEQVRYRCNNKRMQPGDIQEASFISKLQKQIGTDLGTLASTPLHTSKIRDWLSFFNITRIQLVFSRITVKQGLLVANDLHWLEKLESVLGQHIDVNGMVATLDSTAGVFNVLSVGIFVARFMINAGTLLKHTCFPSQEEQAISWTDRFCSELKKRHCDYLNDIVWGSVNGLTNYAQYFNIPGPTANWILAGFLFFDVALLIYRRQLAQQDYLVKREQYEYELRSCELFLVDIDIDNPVGLAENRVKQDLLQYQLEQLDFNWQVTNATYWFNVSAAALLMSGFSASLLLSSPVAGPFCFFVGAIAVAMYISADMYGKYHEKSLTWQLKEESDEDTETALSELDAARYDFAMAMTKNTFMPMFLLVTVAVSLPAALAVTTLYVGYESTKGYLKLASRSPDDAGQELLSAESQFGV